MLRSPGAMSIVSAVSPTACAQMCGDVAVCDAERARGGAVDRPPGQEIGTVLRQQPVADQHRVFAGGRARPQQPHTLRGPHGPAVQDPQRRRERREPLDGPGLDDRRGEAVVERPAGGEQRLEHGAVVRQRAVGAAAVARDAVPRLLGVDVEQHGGLAQQPLLHPLGEDSAAAEGDHLIGRRPIEQLQHEPLLGRPERGLAALGELLRHRVAELLGEELVAVVDVLPERRPELAGGRRLPGPHEADQDDCHPIRSR